MDLQEIEVWIDKNGETRIEVRGVKGGQCLAVTAGLEKALGGEVVSREMTAEAQAGNLQSDQNWQWQSGS